MLLKNCCKAVWEPGAEKTMFVPLRTPVQSSKAVVVLVVVVGVAAVGAFGAGLPAGLHWKFRLLARAGASANVTEL